MANAMSLKSTGLLRKAVFSAFASIVILGSQALWFTYLILYGDWSDVWGFQTFFFAFPLFFLLLIDVLIAAAPFITFWQWRGFRAAAIDTEQSVPLATKQPDPSLAIRDGETITLVRTLPLPALARQFFTTAIALLIFAVILEAGVATVLPPINPFYGEFHFFAPPPPAPSLFDWIVAGYVPVLTLMAIIALTIYTLAGWRDAITADDRGVTVSKTLYSKQFIPWSDIKLFIQPVANKSDTPVGAYLLWGERRFLSVQIQGKAVTNLNEEQSRRTVDRHEYPGGYDAYLENGRRLLATVPARSYTPLRILARNTRAVASLARRIPVTALDLDDALALPEARKELQPVPEVVQAALTNGTPVVLGVRLNWLAITAETLLCSAVLIGLILRFTDIWSPSTRDSFIAAFTEATSFQDPLAGALLLGILVFAILLVILILILTGLILPLAQRQRALRRIIADQDGLALRELGARQESGRIPWRDIRAWAVIQRGPNTRRKTTYILLSETQKVYWTEPEGAKLAGRRVQGDRRAAYHARAAQLHATIAARTGLPLREIRLDDASTANV
jgi:hypothetical protein